MSTTISWKENNIVLVTPLDLGSLEALDISATKLVTVQHDSTGSLIDCALFLGPNTLTYSGSRYPQHDFDQLIWYGDNYPDYGLSLTQTYNVFGQVESYDVSRLVDFSRFEQVDIFAGSFMEILDGPFAGETAEIASYNVEGNFFTLVAPFSGNVTGAQYTIPVSKTDYIKTGSGASLASAIPLLNKAGIIERNEVVELQLSLKIPKFAYSAAKLNANMNMIYLPTVED